MKILRALFNDWLTRLAGIIFVLILVLTIFNLTSDLPEKYPLFGVFNFSMVPVLFVIGGIIFILAILRSQSCPVPAQTLKQNRTKYMFLMSAGATGIILLVISGYQLIEFSDSVAFCGRLCHEVMYPEYTAFQASPHSRVTCAECHVGSGADYLVKSKVSGIPLIFTTLSQTYDRPIPTPVENLRPARETCEQCHRPERFAGDIVREHTTFAADENNTQKVDVRVLRVGGGEFSVARDINWHIAADVWYLPLDKERQKIAWVGVEGSDGQLTEYVDPEKAAEITPQQIAEEKRLMDCIDCHNRATHIFRSPDELIDSALLQGNIDGSLPFIKREGIKALDPPNSSLEEAVNKVEAIKQFYQNTYPQLWEEKKEVVTAAVEELKEIARLTTFPEMNVTWNTYIDNTGHTDSPGCFRCHGKLEATSANQKGTIIDSGCESCHYFRLP